MRDPARIRPLLDELARDWVKNPDLQLGQLLINAALFHANKNGFSPSMWQLNDEAFVKTIVASLAAPPKESK